MKTMMMNIIWRDEDYLFANKSRTYRHAMGAKWGSSARTNKASDLSTQEMRRVQQSFYDEKFHIFMCNAAD